MKNLDKNHPIEIYLNENILIKGLLNQIKYINIENDFETFYNIFNHLNEVDKHYTRKENQLFPYIERYGWETTTQYMWTFHDQIRDELKQIKRKIEENKFSDITFMIEDLINNMNHMILLEETTLFPNAINSLNNTEWQEISIGDKEIGFMIDIEDKNLKNLAKTKKLEIEIDAISYDEDFLTPNQVNLIFKHLPLDITYVDENDRVVFYNNGDERIFPRSPGIIGREVKFCHPPKSVDQVLQILESFKNGKKDSAEFWINFKDKLIHIRFFAIRDENKTYKGVMEITQDITDIKDRKEEKRLLV
ncbi:PAS domain-containing protein [Arcobacter caeni]|uniref:Hemerythrin-like domain-containing protein n=1 Tax=Arcobacter caeni TaxID=1912877 RepID=A0A363D4L5_9BACT|nr:PAS domain-containing protein [Arcobacter caeni]PUE66037.1 hypothetical protein B0174_01865 [Arcobacter caeni]